MPEKTEAAPAGEPAAAPKAAVTPASPANQPPSSAQIGAIRSACRSDYPKVGVAAAAVQLRRYAPRNDGMDFAPG
ncbi:MAG TPA: hypothetical protein VFK01_03810 [Bradyrhizobium sp.]|nr:hypothetical protein [Bradyrhizobium sp.]